MVPRVAGSEESHGSIGNSCFSSLELALPRDSIYTTFSGVLSGSFDGRSAGTSLPRPKESVDAGGNGLGLTRSGLVG